MSWAVRDPLPRLRSRACYDRPGTVALIGSSAGRARGEAPIGSAMSLD